MKKTSDMDVQLTINNTADNQSNQLVEITSDIAPPTFHYSLLREARDNKKLSLQDVSNQLRISVRQIEALESGDFTRLPQPMIVRGFIRNYARLLGIDATPVLDIYKAKVPEIIPNSYIIESNINQPIANKEKQSWFKYLLASALVLIALAVWLVYMNIIGTPVKLEDLAKNVGVTSLNVNNTQTNIPSTGNESTNLAEPLPEVALPAAERLAAEPLPEADAVISKTGNTAAALTNPSSASDVEIQPMKLVPTASNSTLATTAANALAPSTSANLATLNFSSKQETWINISDVNGHVIYSKVLTANSQDSLQVNPATLPVKVIVGNISGTSLSFNGNAVDLKSYAKVNVARFSLK